MTRTDQGDAAAAGGVGTAERRRTRIVLLTGMSGAGKSTALKHLEDLGYEAVDNLPLSLLRRLLPAADSRDPEGPRAIAVGIDSRTRDFDAAALLAKMERLTARSDLNVRLVFLDSDDDVLARRFTETRRRHPLAIDRPVMDGVMRERRLLEPIRERADMVIDTSQMTLPELRRLFAENFSLVQDPTLAVTVMSFSFRGGLPREADLVFDVRFLANPHYVDGLREKTGLDAAVGAYISADINYRPFFDRLADLLLLLVPHYHREGKSYLTIAVGCTGGRHRSVFVAEELGRKLAAAGNRVAVRHRDAPVGEAAPRA